jgi:catechol 2,3-dioxygenase-like lactoylglutathione lyase family enzyme
MDVSPATSSEPFRTTIAPWLAVSDAQKAVDFYTAAFGAVEIYRLEGDDGKLEVAQLEVGDAAFWVQEDSDADLGALESTSFRMILSVKDPNSAYDRAVAAEPPKSHPSPRIRLANRPDHRPVRLRLGAEQGARRVATGIPSPP